MANVIVTTVNPQDQTAQVVVDEKSDFLEDVKKRVKREDLKSYKVDKIPDKK